MHGSNEIATQKKQEKKTKSANDHEQTAEPPIVINLVSDDEVESCPFWIGLFKQGELSPSEVNAFDNTRVILDSAIKDGISETSPFMLADASLDPPRYIYLIPKSAKTALLTADVTPELIPSIKAWNANKIGIYLAPELINEEIDDISLVELIRDCIESSLLVDYYLYTGSIGLNILLNQAVNIKNQLAQKSINVSVFH